jgi:hypothetical protein
VKARWAEKWLSFAPRALRASFPAVEEPAGDIHGSHARGNDLGNLEMAVSLDFLHFQQIGWKSFSAGSWKSRKPPFPHVHHFHPLRGTSLPWTWSACPGRRGRGERGDVVLVLQFRVRSLHVGFGQAAISLRWDGRFFVEDSCSRALPDEVEQMLASHRLYLDTEYHEGHRANFSSADLTGRDFSGLNLRGIKMDRAVLRGADFTGAKLQSANLIGAILQEARFDRADLSRARLSGANFVSASLQNARLAKADMEFALIPTRCCMAPA